MISFLVRSNYTYIYKILDKKFSNSKFCSFSCKTLEQCSERNSELKDLILSYLKTKVKNKIDIFGKFKYVPKSTAKFIFENVNDFKMTFQSKILGFLKTIYSKKEEFTTLSKNNHMFKYAYKHFQENIFKSKFMELYSSFLNIESFENKKAYLLNFYTLN